MIRLRMDAHVVDLKDKLIEDAVSRRDIRFELAAVEGDIEEQLEDSGLAPTDTVDGQGEGAVVVAGRIGYFVVDLSIVVQEARQKTNDCRRQEGDRQLG